MSPSYIDQQTAEAIAKKFKLPRHFAVELEGRWSRENHRLLLTPEFARHLVNGWPLAVAVSNSKGVNNYTHYQDFFVFDIDNEDDMDRAAIVAHAILDNLEAKGIHCGEEVFDTYTGKKGYRTWGFLDEPLPQNTVFNFQAQVCVEAGFLPDGPMSTEAYPKFTEDTLLFNLEVTHLADIESLQFTPVLFREVGKHMNVMDITIQHNATIAKSDGESDKNRNVWYLTDTVDRRAPCPEAESHHDYQGRCGRCNAKEKIYKLKIIHDFEQNTVEVHDAFSTPTDIDLLIANGKGKLVKIPFSRHQSRARSEFFDIPIHREQIGNIDLTTPPTEQDFRAAIEIFLRANPIPKEKILKHARYIEPEAYVTRKSFKRTAQQQDLAFDIPLDALRSEEIHRRVMNTPCLKCAFETARTKRGVFWERGAIVSTLARAGYSRSDIAAYIRDYINDGRDNMNPRILRYMVDYFYRRKWSSCKMFKHGKVPICPGDCGRDSPADATLPHKIEIPAATLLPIKEVVKNLLRANVDGYILGPPRIGKTTNVILEAKRQRKCLVLVVPRLSIAERTIPRTLEIAEEEGLKIKACVVYDNRRICTYLNQKIKHHRATYTKSALDEIKQISKPTCTKCVYKTCTHNPIHPNTLYGEADTVNGICGYQTILENDWDLLVMSDKKFVSLLKTMLDGNMSPLSRKIEFADLIVFDEVSQLLETPSTVVDLQVEDRSGTKFTFFEAFYREIISLKLFLHSQLPALVPHQTSRVNGKVEILKNVDGWRQRVEDNIIEAIDQFNLGGQIVTVFRRNMTSAELEEFKRFAGFMQHEVEHCAEYQNEALNNILEAIDLHTELEWVVLNVPTPDFPVNISIYVKPKIPEYAALLNRFHGKFILLDATPTVVPVDYTFDRSFVTFNLGNPNEQNRRHMIFPDTTPIYATYVKGNSRRASYYAKWFQRLFGVKNIAFLVTSKDMRQTVSRLSRAQIMYHRGTDVMGVPCDKRIGMSVCLPLAPKDANHWLKVIYPTALESVTPTQLWLHEQARQTVQAEGRFKDPMNVRYSAVFAFGQTRSMCVSNYTNSLTPQPIAHTAEGPTGKDIPPLPLVQMALWIFFGEEIQKHELPMLISAIRGHTYDKNPERFAAIRKMVDLILSTVGDED